VPVKLARGVCYVAFPIHIPKKKHRNRGRERGAIVIQETRPRKKKKRREKEWLRQYMFFLSWREHVAFFLIRMGMYVMIDMG